jgi:hypothetical protein
MLTNERLAEIRARCEAATPGPWIWDEKRFNERLRRRGERKNSHKRFVYALHGACNMCMFGCRDDIDHGPFDYHSVMYLNWYSVKGNVLAGASPMPKDATFIAHARDDIPELLAEIDRLRVRLAATLPAAPAAPS